jgi:hypothetical protein
VSNFTNANGQTVQLDETERSKPQQARIVEEHHSTGPNGEDEIVATDDRGRRWYDVRPDRRARGDLMGFNRTWWVACVVFLVVLAIFPWY